MVHVSSPPYGAAKIWYVAQVTYIVFVNRTKEYIFFRSRKNRYSLVWIPSTMGWYLEVVTYGTTRYGATWYGTVEYCTVPSYLVKVR